MQVVEKVVVIDSMHFWGWFWDHRFKVWTSGWFSDVIWVFGIPDRWSWLRRFSLPFWYDDARIIINKSIDVNIEQINNDSQEW